MAASIPWSEILLCLWTLLIGLIAYLLGLRAQGPPKQTAGFYDYTAKVSRAGKTAIEKAGQQEYDDPWSAALRGDGEKENTV